MRNFRAIQALACGLNGGAKGFMTIVWKSLWWPHRYSVHVAPLVSKVNSLEDTDGSCGVLRGVASMDVVGMAMSPVLKQCLSLLVHPRTIQQTLQLIGLSGGEWGLSTDTQIVELQIVAR